MQYAPLEPSRNPYGINLSSIADDRRIRKRWPCASTPFQVWLSDSQSPAKLLDFNEESLGIGFREHGPIAIDSHLSLELRKGRLSLAHIGLHVKSVVRNRAELRVGGRVTQTWPLLIPKPSISRAGELVELRDLSVLKTFWAYIEQQKPIVKLTLMDGRFFQAQVVGRDISSLHGSLFLKFLESNPIELHRQEGMIEVLLQQGTFFMKGCLNLDGNGCLRFLEPLVLLSCERRWCERIHLSSHQGVVRWPHPLIPNHELIAELMDISSQGLAVRLRPEQQLAWRLALPKAMVLQVQDMSIPFKGEFCHVIHKEKDEALQIGLRIHAIRSKDSVRLAQLCQQLRFPSLSSRRFTDSNALMTLLRASGYLSLREETAPSTGWFMPPGDERLSIDVVYNTPDKGLLGHGSCSRVYSKTWLYHQLATIGYTRRALGCRRDLYLHMVEWVATLTTDAGGYGMAYFNQNNNWHKAVFSAFVDWIDSDSLALIVSFDRFERIKDRPKHTVLTKPSNIVVRRAHPEELSDVVDTIRRAIPPLLADAMDIHPSSLMTNSLCHAHTKAGLKRGRCVWVLESKGELQGVALCETGSRRLSLFNIFNQAQVFFCSDRDPPSEAAQQLLLHHVEHYYHTRGVSNPLILAPPGILTAAGLVGLSLVETVGCFVQSAASLKQYRTFLNFQLSRYLDKPKVINNNV